MTRRPCLRLQRQLHGSAAGGEREFVVAGEPAHGGHDQVGGGIDRLCDRREGLTTAFGQQAPNFADDVADVEMRQRSGAGGNY